MATDIEKLVIQLSADVRGYQKALDRAQRSTNTAARGIENRFRQMNRNVSAMFSSFGKGLFTGALSAVSIGAVTKAVDQTIKSVAHLGDQAIKAGISAEALQAIGDVAAQAGSDVDKLTDAVVKLNVRVGEAQTRASSDLGKIFAANRLQFSADPLENFRKVADLIRNARTEQDKATIGAAAFGRSYAEVLQILNMGADAIREGEQAARDAGRVIDNELVAKAKDFDDRWTRAWNHWSAVSKGSILKVLNGLDLIAQHPGFFARAAAEGLTGLDFGSATHTGIPQVDRTNELKALERQREETARLLEGALPGLPLTESLKRQLDVLDQQIKALKERNKLLNGGSVGTSITGFAPSQQTVVPQLSGGAAGEAAGNIEKASSHLEGAIDKFARDVVAAESGGVANARNPRSTATGLGQFIESTFIEEFRKAFPDRAANLSREAILALRTDAQVSFEVIKQYARTNSEVLQKAGVSVDEANLQLAHFLGAQGAIDVLKAAPGTPVANVLPSKVITANPEVLGGGKTVDDVVAYAEARTRVTEELKRNKEALDSLLSSQQAENDSLSVEGQAMQMATFEAEKLRKEHELLAQLRAEGVDITPEISAAVSQLATQYANEKVAIDGIAQAQQRAAKTAEQMQAAQQQAAQVAQELSGAFQSSLKGFISDLVHGVDATEALQNALSRLADQLLDIALNQIFASAFGGGVGGGGLLGGLFAGIFHKGAIAAGSGGPGRRIPAAAFLGAPRYHSGGWAGFKPGELPAIVKRGEPIGAAAVDAAARKLISLGGASATQAAAAPAAPNVPVTVVNRFDATSFLSEALATPAGSKLILNAVRSQPAAFRAAING